MPLEHSDSSSEVLYQRKIHENNRLSRLYWDYKDEIALRCIPPDCRRIVDIGCGEGIFLERLVKHFPHSDIIGFDVFYENIEICAKHHLPARIGDVYRLDIETDQVDCVTLMEVIEHLSEATLAIKEIYRVLRPGGSLVIIFPNDAFFWLARILTFKFKEAAYDPGHVKQWTHSELRRVLTECGFTVTKSVSVPFGLWPISLHGITKAVKPDTWARM